MVCFALLQILRHGAWRRFLGDYVQEEGAPANHALLVAERDRELELAGISISQAMVARFVSRRTDINSVLVDLENGPQHLASFQARLIYQPRADVQQLRKCNLNNAIELGPVLGALEAVYPADSQQALDAGKDRIRVIRVKKLLGDLEEFGPLGGEIKGENLLEGGDELGANGRRGCGQHGDEALAEVCLLRLRYGLRLRVVLGGRPALGYAVLQVNNGCGEERLAGGHGPERG